MRACACAWVCTRVRGHSHAGSRPRQVTRRTREGHRRQQPTPLSSVKAAAPPAGRAPPDPGAAVLVLGGRRVFPRAGGTQRDYRLLAAAVVSRASRRARSLLHASDGDLRLPLTGCFVGIHDYNWMSSVVHVSGQRVTTLGPAVSFCDVIAEHPGPRPPACLSPRVAPTRGPHPWTRPSPAPWPPVSGRAALAVRGQDLTVTFSGSGVWDVDRHRVAGRECRGLTWASRGVAEGSRRVRSPCLPSPGRRRRVAASL